MHAVIVGNGIAGVTAARHVRKARPDARITLVSDEGATPYARTALMYVHMGTLTRRQTALYDEPFWAANGIDRVVDRATGLDADAKTLALAGGGALAYDALLVATGSRPVVPPWLGADLAGVQGLYDWADLDRMEATARGRAVVVGGGLIGVEMSEMLRVRGLPVTFLVREATYLPRAFSDVESALVAAEIRRHGVDLRFCAEVARVEGTEAVEAVTLASGDRVAADWLGVGAGVRPRVEWLDGSGVEVQRGVVVDDHLKTSAPSVWAAGDCCELAAPPGGEPPTRPIWYTARLQGATAGLGMAGLARPYAPGVFYNSAKFFDLEWQVYGDADPQGGGEDATWTDGRRSVRLRHDGGRLLGVNALGVRLRAETVTAWIADGASPDHARRHLADARFDPELSRGFAHGSWT